MHDFSLHHKSATAPSDFVPKGGDLVSAKFSDGSWYRAKIRRVSHVKREAEVTFIDYGNQKTIAFKDIRPLDPKFRSLPGQAHDARLRCRLLSSTTEAQANLPRMLASSNSQTLRANTMLKPLKGFELFARALN